MAYLRKCPNMLHMLIHVCKPLTLMFLLLCKYVLNCRLVWVLNCMLINTSYGPQSPSGVRPKQSLGHIDVVPKQNKTKNLETWSEFSSTIYFFNQILQIHLKTQALSALVTGNYLWSHLGWDQTIISMLQQSGKESAD